MASDASAGPGYVYIYILYSIIYVYKYVYIRHFPDMASDASAGPGYVYIYILYSIIYVYIYVYIRHFPDMASDTSVGLGNVYIYTYYTDYSSDSASHTHSARRPSAAALLTRSRGGSFTPPPLHTPTLRHTLSPTGLRWVSTLSLSLSLPLSL